MAHKKTNLSFDRKKQLFNRVIGYKLNDKGQRVEARFWLGRNESLARIANARLEALWEVLQGVYRDAMKPVWGEVHPIARAVARGDSSCVLDPVYEGSPTLQARWLLDMQELYAVAGITLLAHDPTEVEAGKASIVRQFAKIDSEVGELKEEWGRGVIEPVSTIKGKLHQAFDAYLEHIKSMMAVPGQADVPGQKKKLRPQGYTSIKNVGRLKEHHPNMPLARLDQEVVEGMVQHWRNRPIRKGTLRPIKISTAQAHIKELMRFFRWLNKTAQFAWKKPEHFSDIPTSVARTSEEKSKLVSVIQADTYSIEELTTMYKYASPLMRCYMLVALNTSAGVAELASLRLDEVGLFQVHPQAKAARIVSTEADSFIRRLRVKTTTYGEWKLWAATVDGLQWWLNHREWNVEVQPEAKELVFCTIKGNPILGHTEAGNRSTRIPGDWLEITDRVRKDIPEFRKLSFGKLRKTGTDMIRQIADGETASIFESHSQPVKSDKLVEVYTNKNFAKLHKAIEEVGRLLAPMFAAVADPFTPSKSPNIGRAKVERIKQLRDDGMRISEIAKELDINRCTVRERLTS